MLIIPSSLVYGEGELTFVKPLSMEFFRQEYWSWLPLPSIGNHPKLGIKPASPALVGRFFTTKPPGKPYTLK